LFTQEFESAPLIADGLGRTENKPAGYLSVFSVKETAVNYWQRIGVVTSVLWLVGLPFFVVVERNRHAADALSACVASAYDHETFRFLQEPGVKTAEQQCLRRYLALSISPQQLLRLLTLNESPEQGVGLWASLLLPVLTLWLTGAIVLMVIRFSRSRLRPQIRPTELMRPRLYSGSSNRSWNRVRSAT
jgi:hypothetical protein